MPKEFYGHSSEGASKHGYKHGHANMPSEVVMKEYPRDFSGVPYHLMDSAYGLDKQAKSNEMQVNRDMYNPYAPPKGGRKK